MIGGDIFRSHHHAPPIAENGACRILRIVRRRVPISGENGR